MRFARGHHWRWLALVTVLLCMWSTAALAQDDDDDDDDDADVHSLGYPSRTPEIDNCKPPKKMGDYMSKLPLTPRARDVTMHVWKWLGAENRRLRAQAKDHYNRALTLYNQGDYDGAIDELVAAYCHVPAYSVLYNIAQSFERQVKYEKAVAYLNRYILESPEDKKDERARQSYRVQFLKRLPARVNVATFPPRARVSLRSEIGINARGVSNDNKAMLVRAGEYTMKVSLPGHVPITQKIRVKIGQPYSYYFRLEPQRGTVAITTAPPDARIFIDQKLVSIGKYVERIPVGKHTVAVEAKGRIATQRSFEVLPNRTTSIREQLRRRPSRGRKELLIASTLGGGFLGSGAAVSLFGPNTSEASIGGAAGIVIGLAGAYYGVPKDISVGDTSLIIGSTLIGAAEGGIIASFFGCKNVANTDGSFSEDCNEDAIGGATIVAAIGGLAFGAVAAPRLALTPGDAALINSGAMWGITTGALFVSVFDADARVRAPLWFGGINLGVLAGAMLARQTNVSRGHVALIDLSGLAGMIAGVASASFLDESGLSERKPHLALLGMSVGLITGAYLTRRMDEPKSATLAGIRPHVGSIEDARGRPALTLNIGGLW